MQILFVNANVLNSDGTILKGCSVGVHDEYITSVDPENRIPEDLYAYRMIPAQNMLITPALYNAHSHLPMSILKGYAEDLPLDKWLFDKIMPAEDKFNDIIAYNASMLAIAEQIKNGVVSFSDMYFLSENILKAVEESGVKINFSRGINSFDENENPKDNIRFIEAQELYKKWHNACDGRIKIDMSIHAEYTSNANIIRAVSEFSAEHDLINHTHISETKKEHEECIARHGVTPIKWFEQNKFFDNNKTNKNNRAIAAHCVWVTDEDLEIMREKNISVAHCPASNLKLASGIARVPEMIKRGLNVCIGTDGGASNNNLDILKEMYLASIIQKGVNLDSTIMPAKEMLKYATVNSAKAQGREDCGIIAPGKRADLIAFDLTSIEATPIYDYENALLYSLACGSHNIAMTICDGNILYERGEFKTIDIDKIKHEIRNIKL